MVEQSPHKGKIVGSSPTFAIMRNMRTTNRRIKRSQVVVITSSEYGEIGNRIRLRSVRSNPWGFKSLYSHCQAGIAIDPLQTYEVQRG